ncbi:hypothetical protein [Primorskyibacter marinus]|nr:hypothetical protein [Primorskyibacter marinus]
MAESKEERIAVAGAYREYLDALKADDQGEIFTIAQCARGRDT